MKENWLRTDRRTNQRTYWRIRWTHLKTKKVSYKVAWTWLKEYFASRRRKKRRRRRKRTSKILSMSLTKWRSSGEQTSNKCSSCFSLLLLWDVLLLIHELPHQLSRWRYPLPFLLSPSALLFVYAADLRSMACLDGWWFAPKDQQTKNQQTVQGWASWIDFLLRQTMRMIELTTSFK